MEVDDGITQAMRCIAAMEGEDEETRVQLWRAAAKYAARDRTKRTGAALQGLPARAVGQ